MENTVKIWLSRKDFDSVQKGSFPKEFLTTQPSNLSDYVEMTVGINTLTEWVSKHKDSSKSNKNYLFD